MISKFYKFWDANFRGKSICDVCIANTSAKNAKTSGQLVGRPLEIDQPERLSWWCGNYLRVCYQGVKWNTGIRRKIIKERIYFLRGNIFPIFQ